MDVLHGERRQDDYDWLRQKDDPEVLAHLRGENTYTDLVMKPTETFQAALYAEMLARIKEDDTTVPFQRGRHFYYSRTEKGRQYPIYCRREGSLAAPEAVTLDLNALAEGHAFLSVGAHTVSDDGRLLAYSVDVTGSREYTLHVKDLRTGRVHITSQNHGFAVDAKSMEDSEFEITHMNLNDNTVEGMIHKELPVFSVQDQPEAHPGPWDNEYIFREFAAMARK